MRGPSENPNALLAAFSTLVEAAEPAVADAVLRRAMRQLLEVNPARRVGSRKDAEAWSGIRDQLRAAMAAEKITAMQLAGELGLSESAIDKASAPNGPVPSDATIGKVQTWLGTRHQTTAPTAVVDFKPAREPNRATSAGNGADIGEHTGNPAAEPPTSAQTNAQNRASKIAVPELSAKPAPSPAGNGVIHRSDGRLDQTECERLAFILTHDAPRLRGVASRELIERAAAGALLPVEAIDRLRAVLAK